MRGWTSFLLLATTGCTFVGQGEGEVTSDRLVAATCWEGAYDLDPSFFATNPSPDRQQIRVQRGGDLVEVSDGVAIQVNDVEALRESSLGAEIPVGLPLQLLKEVDPGITNAPDPQVTLALFLQFSCHNQNVVLYAVEGTMVFDALFSGDPNEGNGEDKLTDARFDVMLADPRDAELGGTAGNTSLDIPDDKKSHLTGWFRFNFQRGQPGQPFP
ncbi:MAG: hypothetical protein KC731_37850 [Myxococcales bacterium]|nr:hypothetical protein [Myxococcales bacterium]